MKDKLRDTKSLKIYYVQFVMTQVVNSINGGCFVHLSFLPDNDLLNSKN